ncbi:LexA regulated protein [Sodalis sp. dw_96]|uniref:LexA regulated protein n=1 Tax=Sodalis sp. dw_96 TaxID=2719794 RepID=UPI001BD5BE55|nr:LexA regulated protein [Sodalis sp. dw_96]
MAKEQTDRTTLDLFIDEKRPGRPKTNPLSRDEQLRINKRNQLRRDKVRGLRRVELKINAQAVDALNELAFQHTLSRSELIEQILLAELERHRGTPGKEN